MTGGVRATQRRNSVILPRDEDNAFHPAGRVGTPDDIAALAAFLVGRESGFITGAEFIVDGGVTGTMFGGPIYLARVT